MARNTRGQRYTDSRCGGGGHAQTPWPPHLQGTSWRKQPGPLSLPQVVWEALPGGRWYECRSGRSRGKCCFPDLSKLLESVLKRRGLESGFWRRFPNPEATPPVARHPTPHPQASQREGSTPGGSGGGGGILREDVFLEKLVG
jgi:hypothetical protein